MVSWSWRTRGDGRNRERHRAAAVQGIILTWIASALPTRSRHPAEPFPLWRVIGMAPSGILRHSVIQAPAV